MRTVLGRIRSKRMYSLMVTVGFALTTHAAFSAQEEAVTSIWDGVYSEPQALRGAMTFQARCRECHESSEFAGDAFMEEWNDSTVGDLFDFLRYAMPAFSHEGYGSDEYAEVIAYMLRMNDIPAGEANLPSSRRALRLIRVEAAPSAAELR